MNAIVKVCNHGYDILEQVEIWTSFPSSQKEWSVTMTISDKNGIYDLPDELSTNIRIF